MENALKKFIKTLLGKNKITKKALLSQMQELEWAEVFHDSIRGKIWLENLPLNIGRWAGNYSFFYVLNRILNDFKPKSILEFGLGESTKFISTYIENYLVECNHQIIEQDENWKELFNKQFKLGKKSNINISPIQTKKIRGHLVQTYGKINLNNMSNYELFVIDGPIRSKHYSRYDIMGIAKNFTPLHQFIILFDDYNRKGEKETINDLLNLLKNKEIEFYKRCYTGNKDVLVIATKNYKYATSL